MYEQVGEPPCCKFGGEPYDDTFVGERCPYLGVVRDELKPCPWEKPGDHHDIEIVDVGALMWVRCATCLAAGPCEDSREKAAAAWNARAAVTDEQFAMAVHDGRAWQVVRECHVVTHSVNGSDVCESCDLCDYGWHRSIHDKPFGFCPNCGAKVIPC